jgi:hypothetical protein
LDTNGTLQETFANAGVGRYYYMGFPFAFVRGYMPMEDGMAYIWGSYHGYNDGTTNDTLQRFVTRLYGPDFTTAVSEVQDAEGVTLYPNPANSTVEFRWPAIPQGPARITVFDPSGRAVLRHMATGTSTLLDVGALSEGMYMVVLEQDGQRKSSQHLAIQH